MFLVIENVFSPEGNKIDSYDIATFNTELEANNYAEKLTLAQDNCPPNFDENRCKWWVEASIITQIIT